MSQALSLGTASTAIIHPCKLPSIIVPPFSCFTAISSHCIGRERMARNSCKVIAFLRFAGRKSTSVCLSIGLAGFAAAQQDHKSWPDYGGGPDSSHFVALEQINKSNVSQLQIAWTYPVGDDSSYVFNPIIVDKVMYVLARKSSLVAIDAATGKEIWIHANLPGITTRGIAYWESKDRHDRRLI